MIFIGWWHDYLSLPYVSIILDKKERQEIANNKEVKSDLEEKEVEMKPEKDKHALEINKDEKKTVEIQSEMPGLNEKTDEKKSKDGEDLEIPSFLRNQSN